jgi:hypothetical protein
LGERKTIEEVNGGDNSTNLKNTNLDRKVVHIHGGMECNPAKYAKYYYCKNIKITRSSEFTRETDHNIRIFF